LIQDHVIPMKLFFCSRIDLANFGWFLLEPGD